MHTNTLPIAERLPRATHPINEQTPLDLMKTRQPVCETHLAEMQEHAARKGWGGVSPDSAWEVIDRGTGRRFAVQRRGAFFLAASANAVVGPCSSVSAAVRGVRALLGAS